MRWYYKVRESHTYVRVFMSGALCGELCFSNEEFRSIRADFDCAIVFLLDSPMTPEPVRARTPYAVDCPEHGLLHLTEAEYNRQIDNPDARWKCPKCGGVAVWSDEVYEEANKPDPLDRPTETAQDKKDRDADAKGDSDMDKRRAGE